MVSTDSTVVDPAPESDPEPEETGESVVSAESNGVDPSVSDPAIVSWVV